MGPSVTPANHIETIGFNDALSERYLAYALSTIMSRSLPDVRDGLKPVHRRLLYAMHQLKLDPKSGYKKCARIVGDVMGKYHPHGDVAIYDTLVRLAQSFSVRYPLIDGQGNFGSIDGDNAAAMRYTESRLTDIAMRLLADIDKETVDFRPTYDGHEEEPIVMPACFPNLLANGSEGIAVGMATSIPPHNIGELCNALIALVADPEISIEALCQHIHGPDFPTGGILIEPHANIVQAYRTGRGSFRLRARWHKEALSHGLYQLVITEIPYQVSKSRLIERLAELLRERKLVLVGNLRDESDEQLRIIVEPRSRSIDPDMLMESLFKLTDLEVRISLNMNALDHGTIPRVMSLKEVLSAFLAHRMEIMGRRAQFRLGQIERRLDILAGLLIAYLNLDEVIALIRSEDEPKPIMIARWHLTDTQAEAILNMRLRSLRKLEEIEIRREHDSLSEEQRSLLLFLSDEKLRHKALVAELKALQRDYPETSPLGKRLTSISDAPAGSADILSIEAFVEREPVTVSCSKMGWIRAVKGHGLNPSEFKYKDGDGEGFTLEAYTTDKLCLFTRSGRCFTMLCDRIPKGKGHGDPLRLMIDLEADDTPIALLAFRAGQMLLVASSQGKGFQIAMEDVLSSTRTGRHILVLPAKVDAVACHPVQGDHLAIIGDNRKLLIFPVTDIPMMRRGQGVALQKYKDGGMADITTFNREQGLTWRLGERTRTEPDITTWLGKRSGSGRMAPVGFPRSNKFQ
jgi:topoisomerase-4 subunit A